MSFIASRDVDAFSEEFAVADGNGAAIDHERRSIMAGHRHDTARHILVAARDSNAGIMMLSASDGLDAISDDLSTLERESHAWNDQS